MFTVPRCAIGCLFIFFGLSGFLLVASEPNNIDEESGLIWILPVAVREDASIEETNIASEIAM